MSELPDGWASVPLRDLGVWVGGGTPSKANPAFWSGGKIPWVSPKDMKVNVIGDTEDHITKDAVSASATNVVPGGSVLVVTRSGILRHSLPVAVAGRQVSLNQDLKALVPHRGVVSHYIAWALRCLAKTILKECAKGGTTVQSIETNQLLDFAMPLAPTAEQERIVVAVEEQFSRLDAGVAALERVIGSLTKAQGGRVSQLRSSMLATAFSGKLVPQDPDDEPVSVLLERIAAERASPNGHKPTKARSARHRKVTT